MKTTDHDATAPGAGRREWIGLAVLALACLLYSMDLTVLHLAVPSLSADLRPSSVQLLWIIDVYGFMVAGSLIAMGTLGDRIGRRKLLLIGATAFSPTSILAAFSVSAEMLILSRALMGVAGATLAPSTLSLIFTMFHDPRERSAAIAVWISSFSAGGALGIAILGSIGTAVYRSELASRLPANVPPETAAAARDTLGAALLAISRAAFVQGLPVAAAVSAIVAITAALLAVVVLRHVPAGSAVAAGPGREGGDRATRTFEPREAEPAC